MPQLDADVQVTADEVRCLGAWTVGRIAKLGERLDRDVWPAGTTVTLDGAGVSAMDTAGAWLLRQIVRALERDAGRVTLQGLRPEYASLLALVDATAFAPAETGAIAASRLERIGALSWRAGSRFVEMLAFVGEVARAALRSASHPARIRWRTVLYNVRTAGFDALPITGLLCFLMGIVIAYQGATQLARYGANIFVADLVGLAMVRELAPLLTAIIVAGRSGSAYAAQIGTMKVTEEIDALRTRRHPSDRAARAAEDPRAHDRAAAAHRLRGRPRRRRRHGDGAQRARRRYFADFLDRLQYALVASDFLVGIGKAPVFAAIIAVVGCFQGFQVAGDAESVGRQDDGQRRAVDLPGDRGRRDLLDRLQPARDLRWPPTHDSHAAADRGARSCARASATPSCTTA